jgi:hypothetical protein
MKPFFLILIVIANSFFAQSQDKIYKDLDGDLKKDTIYFNNDKTRIICRLTSQNLIITQSQIIENVSEKAKIIATRTGFEFKNDWDRSGYAMQFQYNTKEKRIQLVAMSRYDYGNSNYGRSGQSNVNLLTNSYVGNWSYYIKNEPDLISIPPIKTKMIFDKTFLDTFSHSIYDDYAKRCTELSSKYLKSKK